jgi:hypothetical protein
MEMAAVPYPILQYRHPETRRWRKADLDTLAPEIAKEIGLPGERGVELVKRSLLHSPWSRGIDQPFQYEKKWTFRWTMPRWAKGPLDPNVDY